MPRRAPFAEQAPTVTPVVRYLITSLAAGAGCVVDGIVGFMLLALLLASRPGPAKASAGLAMTGMLAGAAGGSVLSRSGNAILARLLRLGATLAPGN